MADTKTPDGKTLSVGKSTLSLKPRTETGVVRQSFSHGRSKQVVVEVKKRRTLGPDGKPEAAAPAPAAPAAPVVKRAAPAAPAAKPAAPAPAPAPAAPPAPKSSGVVLRTLTEEEQSRRARRQDGGASRPCGHSRPSRACAQSVRRGAADADR